MGRLFTLDDLQKQFEQARDKLSHDRLELLAIAPLPEKFSHDEYGFSYLRAERIGMGVIMQCLKEVSWLPMKLDPMTEVVLEDKKAIKKWLSSSPTVQPDSEAFGNDFIHTLTRVALTEGWQSQCFRTTALRVGELFHDLSCLIGLIYYGVWLAENGIASLPISNPDDLERTAREIATMTRSPEITQFLHQKKLTIKDEKVKEKTEAPEIKKTRPTLRVIENADWGRDPPLFSH